MKQNKDRSFTVRFTEEQFRYIEKQAERALMSPSNYIRAAAMHSRLKVILDGKAVARELNAIGRNLNQLTVLANRGKIDAVYLDKLHEDLRRLYQGFIELASQEVRYCHLTSQRTFDFLPVGSAEFYTFYFRIVRIEINGGNTETLITNLDSEEFSLQKLKTLYAKRWGRSNLLSQSEIHGGAYPSPLENPHADFAGDFRCFSYLQLYASRIVGYKDTS